MLRYKRHIRLNESELRQFRIFVPIQQAPKTVDAHDRELANAAESWRQLDCAEGELLAALAEDMMIEK